MAVVFLAFTAAVAFQYGRAQQRGRELAVNELELTERLLGDVRTEKDRVEEENELLTQAWSIAEDDLEFGKVIGEGAFGRVYSGRWGHIPVAIKVLRTPLDALDRGVVADFDREVM